MTKKIGENTIQFSMPPKLISGYSVVGPKEGLSLFAKYFDYILKNDSFNEKTYEKAERKMLEQAICGATDKANLLATDIDILLSGDLLNQIISASFSARQIQTSFIGMFGACSTMTESLAVGACLVSGNCANTVACATSSHFSTAERQFRFPLELGNQRPPSSQWTVTGAGSAVVSKSGTGPFITHATIGKIVDMGIKDANNMGSAMAPAALDTIITHFQDTGRKPSYYDAIITGDLGHIGKEIVIELAEKQGYNIKSNYNDCGVLIFDKNSQDTHSGGSGCACCGTVFSGYLFKQLKEKKLKKILLVATGALTNATSSQQGESIPGIAHAVSIEI